MRMKKVLQSTLVAAIAATAWMGAAGMADAESLKSGIAYDPEAQTLTVTPNGDNEIMCMFPKVKEYTKTDTKSGYGEGDVNLTATTWDVYDAINASKGITIDLSKLNRAKNNYVKIKGNKNTDPVVIKIPKVNAYNIVAYDLESTKLYFQTGSKKTDAANPAENLNGLLEYRTQYSGWKDVAVSNEKVEEFAKYQAQGATLYVRQKAGAKTDAGTLSATVSKVYESAKKADATELSDVYSVSAFPGKEVKLAIGKTANGPKVSVNYTTGKVTIPKKAEARFAYATADGCNFLTYAGEANSTGAYGAATTDKSVNVSMETVVGKLGTKDITSAALEVRTAGTPMVMKTPADGIKSGIKTKGKAASKPTCVELKKWGTIDGIEDVTIDSTSATEYFKHNAKLVKNVTVAGEGGQEATVEVGVTGEYVGKTTGSGASKKTTYNGKNLKLTNNSAKVYEVVVCASNATEPNTAADATGEKDKIKKLSAKKGNKNGSITLTLSGSGGEKIFIREAGDAKTKQIYTKWAAFGTARTDIEQTTSEEPVNPDVPDAPVEG